MWHETNLGFLPAMKVGLESMMGHVFKSVQKCSGVHLCGLEAREIQVQYVRKKSGATLVGRNHDGWDWKNM